MGDAQVRERQLLQRIISGLQSRGLLNQMSDKMYLKLMFRVKMGHKLDLKNPRTFNQKLQWLKLYDRKPEYTLMVDKYAVKEFIAEIIGQEYIIPTLGVWETFDAIDFDRLPDQFVLKCTHDSGGIVLCTNKKDLDINFARTKLSRALKENFYLKGREWPYKNVQPRIIAEKYMSDPRSGELRDYKLMCFNGKVKCTFVCTDRYAPGGLKVTFYDNHWNVLPFERHYPKSEKEIERPQNLEKMIELAEILSKNLPFVRCDFYEIEGKIYFGELTFYPGCGWEEFTPESADYELGSWIKLPKQRI